MTTPGRHTKDNPYNIRLVNVYRKLSATRDDLRKFANNCKDGFVTHDGSSGLVNPAHREALLRAVRASANELDDFIKHTLRYDPKVTVRRKVKSK